jgi:hypothetical protein
MEDAASKPDDSALSDKEDEEGPAESPGKLTSVRNLGT